MAAQTWTILTFALCLLGFTAVGGLAARAKQDNTEDYLLAGRSVSPWLTALSAVATNNSGYMFIGLIGYAYTSGFQAVWLQIAWVLGDYAAWRWVQKGVRRTSGAVGALSVSDWLGKGEAPVRAGLSHGADRSNGSGSATAPAPDVGDSASGRSAVVDPSAADDRKLVGAHVSHSPWTVRASAFLTFLFLGGYAAAQLKAGSVSMEVLFGWPAHVGAIIGSVIIVVYCFSGGMRASIWTDAAQSLVMIVSMTLLAGMGFVKIGGFSGMMSALEQQSPELIALAPATTLGGSLLFFCGFLFGGLGGLGQPHILSRVMALRSPDDIDRTRAYYFGWFVPFSLLALLVGLEARVLLSSLLEASSKMGPEHALPLLSVELLPAGLVGLMLAGIFSATMSTADSQVLSCTAAITQDLFPRLRGNYRMAKYATLSTAVLALLIALYATQGVFELVLMAWSVLGATLAPLVILRSFNRRLSERLSLTMMGSGLLTVVLWRHLGLGSVVYEILPGIVVPFLIYWLATALRRPEVNFSQSVSEPSE